MAFKRTLDLAVEDDEHNLTNDDREPPSKRRHFSVPCTPLPKVSHYPSSAPFTPYPSRPFDSPSNPFGWKRIRALTHALPPPTSFSKHLPLRFQLVRPGISPRLGGVYRVVQVPLSYNFIHLRCLIAFLFGGGYVLDGEDKHLFEVKKRAVVYNQTYKPSQIKSGVTVARLSSVRDPCRYRPEDDEDALLDANEDANEKGEDDNSEAERSEDSEEGEGWIWAAAEDFTLGHAWPRGGDLTRGIIYHHTRTTAVHITINTAPIPKRKGISNVPFVFFARGRVRLLRPAPLPLPRPVFSKPTHELTSPASPRHLRRSASLSRAAAAKSTKCISDTELTGTDAEGDTDSERDRTTHNSKPTNNQNGDESATSDHEHGEEEEKDDPNFIPSTSKWNASGTFASYLKRAQQHGCLSISISPYDEDEDEDEAPTLSSMPGLTYSHCSSPISSSSDILTSPLFSSFSETSISIASCAAQPHEFPVSAFGYTPAPLQAQWQRMRIERVSKRMERMKKGDWMCARDEDLDEEDGVDELAEDEDDKPFVKPVLKPGEVWDPFGDEIEI